MNFVFYMLLHFLAFIYNAENFGFSYYLKKIIKKIIFFHNMKKVFLFLGSMVLGQCPSWHRNNDAR